MYDHSGAGNRPKTAYSGFTDQENVPTPKLPLSRQAELAGDAFVAGNMVRLMNRIAIKHLRLEPSTLALLADGILLTKRLQEGDVYLDQSRVNLIQQPESADTVKHMRARGTSNIRELTRQVLHVLGLLKSVAAEGGFPELAGLDRKLIESTRDFFRVVHTSIIDQLDAFEPPALPVDRD